MDRIGQVREDMLWATRTVVEKIRTDQRSRALEMICLGVFHRSSTLHPLVAGAILVVDSMQEEDFIVSGRTERERLAAKGGMDGEISLH